MNGDVLAKYIPRRSPRRDVGLAEEGLRLAEKGFGDVKEKLTRY
jgi:hypothetical protein